MEPVMSFRVRRVLLVLALGVLGAIAARRGYQFYRDELRTDEDRFREAVARCLQSVLARGESDYVKVAMGEPKGFEPRTGIGVVYLEKAPKEHRTYGIGVEDP